jgi:Ni2+-binding GTPase involved in maturation of urease and hydrogenase
VDLSRPVTDLAAMRPGLAVVKTNLLAGEGVDQVLAALKLG